MGRCGAPLEVALGELQWSTLACSPDDIRGGVGAPLEVASNGAPLPAPLTVYPAWRGGTLGCGL
jgi:hypothetical protein